MSKAGQYGEAVWQAWVDNETVIDGVDHDDIGDCACPDAVVAVMIDHAPRGPYGWTVSDALRINDACGESYDSATGEAQGWRVMGECYVVEYALRAHDDANIIVDYEATGRAVAAADTEQMVAVWHSCGACRMLHRFNYRQVVEK